MDSDYSLFYQDEMEGKTVTDSDNSELQGPDSCTLQF